MALYPGPPWLCPTGEEVPEYKELCLGHIRLFDALEFPDAVPLSLLLVLNTLLSCQPHEGPEEWPWFGSGRSKCTGEDGA